MYSVVAHADIIGNTTVDRFLEHEAKGKSVIGAHSIKEFVQKLKKPRRMMLLVQAGKVSQSQ
jgi:6-phosphogluconate dehydrogenase